MNLKNCTSEPATFHWESFTCALLSQYIYSKDIPMVTWFMHTTRKGSYCASPSISCNGHTVSRYIVVVSEVPYPPLPLRRPAIATNISITYYIHIKIYSIKYNLHYDYNKTICRLNSIIMTDNSSYLQFHYTIHVKITKK